MRRVVRVGVVLGLSALSACGGNTSTTSPSLQPFSQTIQGAVSSFGFVPHTFDAPRSGLATFTLTWTNGDVDLDLYMTASSCTAYPLGTCTFLAQSEANTGTREEIRRPVNQGEQFNLWVDNFAFVGESYTLTIGVQ